jgi:cell division GTPase FtsZ
MPRPVSALCASPNDSVLALGFKEVSGLGRAGEREEGRQAEKNRCARLEFSLCTFVRACVVRACAGGGGGGGGE